MGATHGAGTVVLINGIKMLAVPLWRSYLAGCILLGIAPCTAMVLVWGIPVTGQRRPHPGDGSHQFADHAAALRGVGRFSSWCRKASRPLAGTASFHRHLRCPSIVCRLSFAPLDYFCQRRSVVQSAFPARAYTHNYHCPSDHTRAALLFHMLVKICLNTQSWFHHEAN